MIRTIHSDATRRWLARLDAIPFDQLMQQAEAATLAGHGTVVTYSRKVFIPLTKLCRDVCHYCTFATSPKPGQAPFLSRDEVLAIARAGADAGCHEALFTLGDQPEARYRVAREWLDDHGYASTLHYLAAMAAAVGQETGLLPHLNPGIMTAADYAMLRPVSASMGLMLESTAAHLCEKGGPHYGSPDKHPGVRLETIRLAGEAAVPFTTGLLIGIGESRADRVEALLAIRDLHARYGHIQEVIIQNFRAKADTLMRNMADLPLEDHLWTIAAARLILGPAMTIQAPPNLQDDADGTALLRAGVNDWGGVSPVTPDHVNPERPWPHLDDLERMTAAAGRHLRQRLAIGPGHALDAGRWADRALQPQILRLVDGRGLLRDADWFAGRGDAVPISPPMLNVSRDPAITQTLQQVGQQAGQRAGQGKLLSETQIARLFTAEGADFAAICEMADGLRSAAVGDAVTHVINRNINYTNICLFHCGFCAFSKGSTRAERGPAYRIDPAEVADRAREAWVRGAREVCLQGGIHPAYDGSSYRAIVDAVRGAVPGMHIHAFSPLEIHHGAQTLGLDYADYLASLRDAGLASLPGTAAEILCDDVRAVICPDKVSTRQWLAIMRAAHGVGLRSTATIMFGHVERYHHLARHLLLIRGLQEETGGFTEFVPLPFVHMEAPNWRRGETRSGPTWREAVLMHAIARIVLHGAIPNIQASWVKLGAAGAAAMLQAGANDLGGVLMDESITRAAGGVNGQMLGVEQMAAIASSIGRPLAERSTLYALRQPEPAE